MFVYGIFSLGVLSTSDRSSFPLCSAVMCRSPTGYISLAYQGGLLARGRASGKIEVQFLGHSFQSTEMACTTTPWPGGSLGMLPLAPKKAKNMYIVYLTILH